MGTRKGAAPQTAYSTAAATPAPAYGGGSNRGLTTLACGVKRGQLELPQRSRGSRWRQAAHLIRRRTRPLTMGRHRQPRERPLLLPRHRPQVSGRLL